MFGSFGMVDLVPVSSYAAYDPHTRLAAVERDRAAIEASGRPVPQALRRTEAQLRQEAAEDFFDNFPV